MHPIRSTWLALGCVVLAGTGWADDELAQNSLAKMVRMEVLIVETDALGAGENSRLDLSQPAEKLREQVDRWQADGTAQIVNHIRLTTLENLEALVQVGEQRPVVAGRTQVGRGDPRGGVTYRQEQVGTMARLTARVRNEGMILVQAQVEKSRLADPPAAPDSDFAVTPPRTGTTAAQSTVEVPSGATVLLGGMSSQTSEGTSHVLIFLTASVVQPTEGK